MTVVLETLFGQAGNLFFRISASPNHSEILFHTLPGSLENEKNEVVSERGKEPVQGPGNQRGEEVKTGSEDELDLCRGTVSTPPLSLEEVNKGLQTGLHSSACCLLIDDQGQNRETQIFLDF